MTDTQYWAFLRNGLSRMWLKYPTKTIALNKTRRAYKGDNKRQKWEYQCKTCKKWYKKTEVQVDHIVPRGRLTEESHIEGFITRSFCKLVNLQILCVPCHKIKTKEDIKGIRSSK